MVRFDLVPVDPLDGINGRAHLGAALDQPQHLLGLKSDVCVDEQPDGSRKDLPGIARSGLRGPA